MITGKFPTEPTPGKEIPRSWMLDFYRAVRDSVNIRGDNKTIKVSNGVVSAINQPQTRRGSSDTVGTVAIGGLTVATGAVTATVTTISGATLASQSVAIEGAANGVTFNSGVTVFCILSAGVWTAIVDVWDYHQDLPDYDGAANQALVHEAGTLKWLDLGCDS